MLFQKYLKCLYVLHIHILITAGKLFFKNGWSQNTVHNEFRWITGLFDTKLACDSTFQLHIFLFLFFFLLGLVFISDSLFEKFSLQWELQRQSSTAVSSSVSCSDSLCWAALLAGGSAVVCIAPDRPPGTWMRSSWFGRPFVSLLIGLFWSLLFHCSQQIQTLECYLKHFMNLRLDVNPFYHMWSWLYLCKAAYSN